MVKQLTITLLGIAICTGCEVGPDYHAPATDAPAAFGTGTTPTTEPAAPVDLMRWWECFHDPVLDQLIARGVESSLDIRLADARVREARASFQESIGALFPTVAASGSYTRSRNSSNLINKTGGSSLNNAAVISGLTGGTHDLYQSGFDSSWELDVFGGVRRSIESANATYEARQEARRNATITLLSEVARNYILLRGAQHERAAIRDNIAAQHDTLELTQSKFKAGIATDLDVNQQQAQLASTESQLPSLETQIQQSIHRLSVLLDQPPDALEADLTPDAPLPFGPPDVPPGLPSELLLRRPDVNEAERSLAAASAEIGVAIAELYPKFSLTGSFGMESSQLKTFTRGSSNFFSFGPAVNWNLFEGGQLRANIRVQRARYEQAYIQHRQVVLQALQEVEDTLVAYHQEQSRRNSLQRAVDANIRAVAQAKRLNEAGVVDFLNVLNAQQALFIAQDELARSEQAVSADLIALFKSLGGGWAVNEPQPSAPKE